MFWYFAESLSFTHDSLDSLDSGESTAAAWPRLNEDADDTAAAAAATTTTAPTQSLSQYTLLQNNTADDSNSLSSSSEPQSGAAHHGSSRFSSWRSHSQLIHRASTQPCSLITSNYYHFNPPSTRLITNDSPICDDCVQVFHPRCHLGLEILLYTASIHCCSFPWLPRECIVSEIDRHSAWHNIRIVVHIISTDN